MSHDVRKALADADEQYRSTLDLLLRSYVDDEHVERAVELVRRLVLSIPTSLELLVDLARMPGANPALAALATQALDYVADPADLLPESRYGLYGYLDDAYLVHHLVALAYETLAHSDREALPVDGSHFHKLSRLVGLGGKLLPPDVKLALDAKVAHAREVVAARSVAARPALPEPGVDASGLLDRFAQDLARRLAQPPSVHSTNRAPPVHHDAEAWGVSHDQAHFLEHGTRLVPIAGLTSESRFEATTREVGPVHLVVRFRVHAGREEAFLAALDAVSRASQREAGCLAYALVAREAGPTFVLEERWTDGAALAAHARTPHFAALGPALADVLAEPPAIEAFREARDGPLPKA